MPFSCFVRSTVEKGNTHVEHIQKMKICTDDDTLNLASADVTNHEYLIMKTFVLIQNFTGSLRLFSFLSQFNFSTRKYLFFLPPTQWCCFKRNRLRKLSILHFKWTINDPKSRRVEIYLWKLKTNRAMLNLLNKQIANYSMDGEEDVNLLLFIELSN